jgi:hypothetical protein
MILYLYTPLLQDTKDKKLNILVCDIYIYVYDVQINLHICIYTYTYL